MTDHGTEATSPTPDEAEAIAAHDRMIMQAAALYATEHRAALPGASAADRAAVERARDAFLESGRQHVAAIVALGETKLRWRAHRAEARQPLSADVAQLAAPILAGLQTLAKGLAEAAVHAKSRDQQGRLSRGAKLASALRDSLPGVLAGVVAQPQSRSDAPAPARN